MQNVEGIHSVVTSSIFQIELGFGKKILGCNP